MAVEKVQSIAELAKCYLAQVGESLARLPLEKIEPIVLRLEEARLKRQQVFICGNGGSAATASHFACDLAKGASVPHKPPIKAFPLTDSIPLLSAWANDLSYDEVFARKLAPWVQAGDVVIGISGSGNSRNVLNALRLAKEAGATTIGLTGFDGGKLRDIVDICLVVPSRSMEQIEDVHLLVCHLTTTCLREIGGTPVERV